MSGLNDVLLFSEPDLSNSECSKLTITGESNRMQRSLRLISLKLLCLSLSQVYNVPCCIFHSFIHFSIPLDVQCTVYIRIWFARVLVPLPLNYSVLIKLFKTTSANESMADFVVITVSLYYGGPHHTEDWFNLKTVHLIKQALIFGSKARLWCITGTFHFFSLACLWVM